MLVRVRRFSLDRWFTVFLGPRPESRLENLSRPTRFYICRTRKSLKNINLSESVRLKTKLLATHSFRVTLLRTNGVMRFIEGKRGDPAARVRGRDIARTRATRGNVYRICASVRLPERNSHDRRATIPSRRRITVPPRVHTVQTL